MPYIKNYNMALDVKSSEWDSLITDKKLLAVDFWAPYCPYCMKLKPVFEAIAKDYPDIKFVKVNVEQDPDIASKYGIRGIPVIKFFCEGKEIGEIVGNVPQAVLKSRIDEAVDNSPSCLANTTPLRTK
jgi:thioredoxin 1